MINCTDISIDPGSSWHTYLPVESEKKEICETQSHCFTLSPSMYGCYTEIRVPSGWDLAIEKTKEAEWGGLKKAKSKFLISWGFTCQGFGLLIVTFFSDATQVWVFRVFSFITFPFYMNAFQTDEERVQWWTRVKKGRPQLNWANFSPFISTAEQGKAFLDQK